MIVIYLLIALIATIIGGLTGIGGGVIIKPLLDIFSKYDIASINILSSITIFSMAIVSFFKNYKSGFKINKNLFILAIGALVGGLIGKEILFITISKISSDSIIILQSSILAALLIVVLFRNKIKSHYTDNIVIISVLGILLGTTSAFLGVGGGPINVFVLHLFLKMDTKQITISSIFVILLSQLSKLTSIAITTGYSMFNLEMLVVMIPGGIIGGLIGTFLLKKSHSNNIRQIFNAVVFFIICINIFNIIKVL